MLVLDKKIRNFSLEIQNTKIKLINTFLEFIKYNI